MPVFLLLGSLAPGQAQQMVVDKVVAVVGGELILLSEVEEQYALNKAQGGNLSEDARCRIVDNLLTTKLILNQAKLDSIEVADAEVEEQLNARIDRILEFMNGDVSQFEDYYGQTINEVKKQFREDLLNQLLVERMRGQILQGVKVTPSEVRDFFQSIPKDSLPYFNAEVEIREVVYAPEVNAEERQRAIEQLEEIRARIVEGEAEFTAMAQKYSDDGSARVGGDLGWAKRGRYVPEFEAAAYKLDPMEVSPVIETQFGFHIIQMLERRGNSIRVRHILIRPEITEEDLAIAESTLDSVRGQILDGALSFSQAVKEYSFEETQSYTNDGRVVNPATGNTFFEIGDLDPDIYFAIDTVEVGGITAPFEFRSPTGETMFRIVQLQSRTAPHKADLELDYNRIMEAAKESKKNDYVNQWIDTRVQRTYIHVDPMYASCPNLAKWKSESDDGSSPARPRP